MALNERICCSAWERSSGPMGRTRLESRHAGPMGREGFVPPNTRSPTCVEGGSEPSRSTAASCAAWILGVPAPSSAAIEPEASKASRILGVPAGGLCAPAAVGSSAATHVTAQKAASTRSLAPPPSIASK